MRRPDEQDSTEGDDALEIECDAESLEMDDDANGASIGGNEGDVEEKSPHERQPVHDGCGVELLLEIMMNMEDDEVQELLDDAVNDADAFGANVPSSQPLFEPPLDLPEAPMDESSDLVEDSCVQGNALDVKVVEHVDESQVPVMFEDGEPDAIVGDIMAAVSGGHAQEEWVLEMLQGDVVVIDEAPHTMETPPLKKAPSQLALGSPLTTTDAPVDAEIRRMLKAGIITERDIAEAMLHDEKGVCLKWSHLQFCLCT